MDEHLRNLERAASTGDRQALHRLLIRKLALDDFDIKDLDATARFNLATQLLASLGPTPRGFAYLLASPLYLTSTGRRRNSTFYPHHEDNTVCPNGHQPILSDERDDTREFGEFSLHWVRSGDCIVMDDTTQEDLHYMINADEAGTCPCPDVGLDFALLRCDACSSLWPAKGTFHPHDMWA